MKIYAISGLGADYRVFQFLQLDYEIVHIHWIDPEPNEKIEDYALRLSSQVNTSVDFGLMGVSFGGLVATEMSKQIQPKFTILISSAETRYELGSLFPLLGKLNLTAIIPVKLFDIPRPLAYFLFGTDNKSLLNEILSDTDLAFTKWAVNQLLNWGNTERIENCLKLSGTKDKLIPPSRDEESVMIEGGTHFMIVDKADVISDLINQFLPQQAQ